MTPEINIIREFEGEDGSLNLEFEFNEAWEDLVKESLGKEELTEKDMQDFVISVVEKAVAEEDGYSTTAD